MNESKHTQWLRIMERAIAENWPMLPSPPDERDWPLSRIAEPVAIPASVRLDHLVPRILSQGKCGSCVGMAGAQIKNALANRRRALPEGGLSPLFLYARCKQEDGIPTTEGTYPRIALKIMQRDGICPEKDLPYSTLPQNACLSFPQIAQTHIDAAAPYKIKAYARLYGLDDIKQALAAGKLVMAGILVADNFMKPPANNIIGPPEGRIYGLHAVGLCGYDDSKKAFRMVNSWGCYDEKTEVLTKAGFKHFKYLTADDKLATLSSNGELQYQKPTDIISYPYHGEMYKYASSKVDLLVTPNHNMYARAPNTDYGFIQAENIRTTKFIVKRDAKWVGEEATHFYLPEYKHNVNGSDQVKIIAQMGIETDLFLEFLGYWLSEGSAKAQPHKNGGKQYKVMIYQKTR